jgi:hypothetical protein
LIFKPFPQLSAKVYQASMGQVLYFSISFHLVVSEVSSLERYNVLRQQMQFRREYACVETRSFLPCPTVPPASDSSQLARMCAQGLPP